MPNDDAEKIRELAAALDEAADDANVTERGLIPQGVTIGPAAQVVLKMLWRYLPTLFPFLTE